MKTKFLAILLAAGLAGVPQVLAHHGWGYYDTARPIYLSGRVTAVTWRNPHPEITVENSAGALPPDWNDLPVPDELAELGFDATLQRARPAAQAERWVLDLAPINRLQAWGLPREPREGDVVTAIAFPSCSEEGVARPALIVLDGVGVRQQSVALPAGCSGDPRG
ncbi:hypothetical protein SAMN02982989_2530 [Xaviernesmea oryzae]|uniref:Uncharacterized protein n=1 Tax=Xaviernesmea oryzae TaxID=464029 RepID=A0A1X7F9T0_9HYPH|nr:DUF6152 family protein [Xaviernesmea oryzae]SMF48301.1 hypothetical protein SAMN02982989_2530 [Xaviernesmea oryzae]